MTTRYLPKIKSQNLLERFRHDSYLLRWWLSKWFERVITSAKAKISLRKTHETTTSVLPVATASIRGIRRQEWGDLSCVSNNKKPIYFIRGKPEHYFKKCWYRNDNSRGGRVRSRGRGRDFARIIRDGGFTPFNNLQDRTYQHTDSQGRWVIQLHPDHDSPSDQNRFRRAAPSVNTQVMDAKRRPKKP